MSKQVFQLVAAFAGGGVVGALAVFVVMKRKDGYVEEIERDLATLRRENRNFQKAYEAAEKEVLQDRPEDDREFTPLEKPVVIPETYLDLEKQS